MKLLKNPCGNCTKETGRSIGCHATCKKYIDWSYNNELIKEKKEEYRLLNQLHFESIGRALSKKMNGGISNSSKNRYVF